MSTVQGRHAVVTGGTKGTGAAIVGRLRSIGAHVTALARQRHAGDDLTADDFVAVDLASAAGVAAVTGHVGNSGGVQILVHVAGGSGAPSGGFAALTDLDWADELNLNLLAARPAGPRAAADDDRGGCRCGRTYRIDPEPPAALRRHPWVRCDQGRVAVLQQGTRQ
jgi:NAD(P)-dependent dehydrogenase (short-subunit alcohol dehydrogenase family)